MNTINSISNLYYRTIILKYTQPQTTQNYIYSKKNKYVDCHQKLLENKIEEIQYLERQQKQKKIKKSWVIGVDDKGRQYKYNTITKNSKYLL